VSFYQSSHHPFFCLKLQDLSDGALQIGQHSWQTTGNIFVTKSILEEYEQETSPDHCCTVIQSSNRAFQANMYCTGESVPGIIQDFTFCINNRNHWGVDLTADGRSRASKISIVVVRPVHFVRCDESSPFLPYH